MKVHVFISVLVFHVVVIAGLYLLSACSSSNNGSSAEQTRTSPSTGGSIYDQYAQPNRPVEDENLVVTPVTRPNSTRGLDPAFNSGSDSYPGKPTSSTGGNKFQPRRPKDGGFVTLDQPSLNDELRDEEVLKPLSSSRPVASVTPAVQYEVKKGDSLWKISRQFGISLKDLLAANGLTESATIQVGMDLTIPSETSGPSVSAPVSSPTSAKLTESYTVVSGDTLSRIAKKFHTSVSDIKVANGLRSDNIQLNQELTIPSNSGSSSSVASSPKPAASSPTTNSSSSIEGDIIHEVVSGETPGGIAKSYGITTSQLMSDNALRDARSLRVGQKLKIRLGTAQPAAPSKTTTPTNQRTATPPATPKAFDESIFDDLDDIPEVEVVPRS